MGLSVGYSYALTNLMVDGSFENCIVGSYTVNGTWFDTSAAWSASYATGATGTYNIVNTGAQDGGKCFKSIRTDSNPLPWNLLPAWNLNAFYQVTPGHSYTIDFWAHTDASDIGGVQVQMPAGYNNGNLNVVDTVLNQWTSLGSAWGYYSYTFTAPTYAGYSIDYVGPTFSLSKGTVWIDNIRMYDNAPVPEPASILAMLSGLVGFVGFAARKRS
ncbi:MAG: PEP-CTERM sorting domain-containing protein [Armatimonadota bacterium]